MIASHLRIGPDFPGNADRADCTPSDNADDQSFRNGEIREYVGH